MKKIPFLFVPIIVLILSGCSDNNSTDVQEELQHTFNAITPLSQGNIWGYNHISLEYKDKDTSFISGNHFIELTEEKDKNGRVHYFTNGGITGPQWWLYTNSQGLWITDLLDNRYEIFAAKYPCQAGDKWKTTSEYDLSSQAECEVISTNEKRIVDGKEYLCIHYRSTDLKNPEKVVDSYYALNIGKVQEVYFYKGKALSRTDLDSVLIK